METVPSIAPYFDIDPELLGGVPASANVREPAASQSTEGPSGSIPSPPFSKGDPSLPSADGVKSRQAQPDLIAPAEDKPSVQIDQQTIPENARASSSGQPAVEYAVIQAQYYTVPTEAGKFFEYRPDQTMYRPPPGYQLPAHGIIPTRTTSAAHPPHPFAAHFAAAQRAGPGFSMQPGQAGPILGPGMQLGGPSAQFPHHGLPNNGEWAPPDTIWEPMGMGTFAQPVMAAEGRAATLRDARLAWMVGELVCGHPACLGRRFERKTNLLKHLLTHVEARPYICKVLGCDQAFKQKWLLDRHSRVHLPSASREVFKCPIEGCGVTCSSQYNLRNHELVHSELKKYSCDFTGCNRTFATQRNLRLHQRTHTGDKPFVCHYENCGQKYHRLAHLKRHQEVHLEGGAGYGEGGEHLSEDGPGEGGGLGFPKKRRGGRTSSGRKKRVRSKTPIEEEDDDDFMNDPSPDEDSGDDEFGKDDDDLSSPSKPSVTRTRSGRVSRSVNRDISAGVSSQAAARLLAAAAAVDAEEAAAQAIVGGEADERPMGISGPPMEVEEQPADGEMVEEIDTQQGSAEQDGEIASGGPQRKSKSNAVRGRKSTRGRKAK